MESAVQDPLRKEQLDKIVAMASRTSQRPWKSNVEGRDHFSGSDFISTASGDIELSGASRDDQDFIAEATNWAPLAAQALLDTEVIDGRARLPPECITRAALRVLFIASVYTRNWAQHENMNRIQVRDLWEAIHDIPELLVRWEDDSERLLLLYLRQYDEKWPEPSLSTIYNDAKGTA